jgi:chloride channel 3/4/5
MERLMKENAYQGYPIVEDTKTKTLVGYIGRTELRYAIDRAKIEQQAPGHAKCYFASSTSTSNTGSRTGSGTTASAPNTTFDSIPTTSSQTSLDFTRYIDPTPLSVHPRLPLETVMELFKKMGPRVILIEYRGRLTGLVTIKDCLKYQFKVEAGGAHGAGGAGNGDEGMDRLAGWGKAVLNWGRRKVGMKEVGEVRLASPTTTTASDGRDARRGSGGHHDRADGAFTVGDDDDDDDDNDDGGRRRDVELEDRGRDR